MIIPAIYKTELLYRAHCRILIIISVGNLCDFLRPKMGLQPGFKALNSLVISVPGLGSSNFIGIISFTEASFEAIKNKTDQTSIGIVMWFCSCHAMVRIIALN